MINTLKQSMKDGHNFQYIRKILPFLLKVTCMNKIRNNHIFLNKIKDR